MKESSLPFRTGILVLRNPCLNIFKDKDEDETDLAISTVYFSELISSPIQNERNHRNGGI